MRDAAHCSPYSLPPKSSSHLVDWPICSGITTSNKLNHLSAFELHSGYLISRNESLNHLTAFFIICLLLMALNVRRLLIWPDLFEIGLARQYRHEPMHTALCWVVCHLCLTAFGFWGLRCLRLVQAWIHRERKSFTGKRVLYSPVIQTTISNAISVRKI